MKLSPKMAKILRILDAGGTAYWQSGLHPCWWVDRGALPHRYLTCTATIEALITRGALERRKPENIYYGGQARITAAGRQWLTDNPEATP